jgi:hypothetical protein
VALFLRLEVVGFTTELKFGRSSVQSYGLTDRVLLVGRSVATYVQTLVAPWGSIGPLHQGVRPIPADDVRGWTGLVLLALVVAATIVTLVRRQRVGWLLAALLVSLAPVIQILPNELPNGVHAADRYAYFPCFFAVAVAGLLAVEWTERHPARARAAGAAAGALAAALLAGRLHVLPRWNDPERFWTWAVDLAPRAPVAQVNLAMTLLEKGDLAGAERHGRAGGWAGVQALALSLERQGRRADARAALDEAILKNPPAPIARMIRGEIELDEGDAAAAMTDFQAAIAAEAAGRTQFAPISPRAAQLMERARAMLAK